MFGLVLIASNTVACALLLWQGEKVEWKAVAMIVAATVCEALLGRWLIGTWSIGLAMTNLALFLGLWWLTERHDRWWTFLAASVQLVILASHLVPLISSGFRRWTLMTIQAGLWTTVSILLFLGVVEAWLARQYQASENSHDDSRDRDAS